VILAGAVAALAACRERVEPTPRSSRPVTPAVVALCEYARWCGRYTHQDPCEQALAMMHPELPLEIVHALKFEEWRRDCEPPSGVDRPCRAPRWSARFAWGDCHGRLFRHIHCGEPGPCQTWWEEGTACRTFVECGPGLSCAGARFGRRAWGHCESKLGLGEDRTRDLAWACARGLTCSAEPWSGLP